MIDLNKNNIDGANPFIKLQIKESQIYVCQDIDLNCENTLFDFIGISYRKPYLQSGIESDYKMTEFGRYINHSDKPNCEIRQEKNYPRNNPKHISYNYCVYPKRQIKNGEALTVDYNIVLTEKQKMFLKQNNKIAKFVSPLRDQPDYMERNEQQQVEQLRQKLSKQLYSDYLKIGNIVCDLYNSQIRENK